MTLHIVELNPKLHDRKNFDCGNEARNFYLQKLASQHAKKNLSRTFVLCDQDRPEFIIGYYSVSAAQVDSMELPDELASKLPRFPIPAARIGQLAVHSGHQGAGHGALLIQDAVRRALSARESMGVYLLLVDADSPEAANFYRHYGFIECNSEGRTLFLCLGN